MRKLSRREIGLLGLVGVGVLVLGVRWLRPSGAAPTVEAPSRLAAADAQVPRIDLERLKAPRPTSEAGRRDLFTYGPVVPNEAEQAAAYVPPPPPVTMPSAGGDEPLATPTPSLPPLNVKYIGSVENATGVKVAVLVTDRKEVLTGQAGQVVANRYRVAHIGLESVDLEDVSTGQSRRIPLRAR